MQKARIRLTSADKDKLDNVAKEIVETARKFHADVSGPIPLPTKKMKVTLRKSPDGEGSETWERWEMRIHKRLIEVGQNERALRQIMRIHIPDGVNIEVELSH